MRKIVLFLLVFSMLTNISAFAGAIQYIGTGRPSDPVKIAFSRNNGAKWEYKTLKPGQTFHVPKDATHLTINNSSKNPKQDYKIKEGNVF